MNADWTNNDQTDPWAPVQTQTGEVYAALCERAVMAGERPCHGGHATNVTRKATPSSHRPRRQSTLVASPLT